MGGVDLHLDHRNQLRLSEQEAAHRVTAGRVGPMAGVLAGRGSDRPDRMGADDVAVGAGTARFRRRRGASSLLLNRYVSKAMGRLVGPLRATSGFHGAGPVRRGLANRRVTALSASAISRRARFAPRQ